jgi:hypothetical protein
MTLIDLFSLEAYRVIHSPNVTSNLAHSPPSVRSWLRRAV